MQEMRDRLYSQVVQGQLQDISGEFEDLEGLHLNLPYSDLNRWAPENSIYDGDKVFPLARLDGVKALSFLSYVGPKPEDLYFTEYSHTRRDHSLVVALVTEQILRQNVTSQEKIDIGILAGLLHDIAIPAHGDATKGVDPENLDEEKFWWEVLDKKGWEFITQHGGNKKTIDAVIKNGGVLGKVLDVADKITYVMKDLSQTIGPVDPRRLSLEPYLLPLRHILSYYPEIGNIYAEVGVDWRNQEVFFNNPQTLAAFLLLRAHLHQNLYLHPTSQGRDLLVARFIKPLYSRDDSSLLTPEKLRRMTDDQLLDILYHHYEPLIPHRWATYSFLTRYPEYQMFDDEEQAEKRERELCQQDGIAIIGIKRCNGFDPATSYKVVSGYGKIAPLKEFDPAAAEEIERIEQSTHGVYLFWADVSKDSPVNSLLRTVLKG